MVYDRAGRGVLVSLANRRPCSNFPHFLFPSLRVPLLPFPTPPLLFPSSLPPLCRETDPLKPARGSGERCKPQPQKHFAAWYAFKTHLVALWARIIWRAYKNSPTLFQMVLSPTPYGLPSSRFGVCNVATTSYIRNSICVNAIIYTSKLFKLAS